jgi:putative membrane protein
MGNPKETRMKKTLTTAAAAAAMWALVGLPVAAQSTGSGSAGSGSEQQGSPSGSGATDQRGSTHGDQKGAAGSRSGSRTDDEGGTTTKGTSQDRTFIVEAAAGGMAEVELGRLATQKASRSEVKEFGQMMVDDHGKANDRLMKIAQDKGLAAPHALEPEHEALRDRLSKLSGAAFDREYIREMVKDHQKDVASFRKHATAASDPEVKQFASSTLPTLEKHLDRAKELQQMLGGGSPKGTSGRSPESSSSDRDKSEKAPGASGSSGSGTTPPQPR